MATKKKFPGFAALAGCWQARAMSNRTCLKLKWLFYGEQTKSTSQCASVLCVGVKAANTQLLATTAFSPALPVHLTNFSRRCTRLHCPGRRVERAQAADCLRAVLTTDPGTDLLYLPGSHPLQESVGLRGNVWRLHRLYSLGNSGRPPH